MITAINSAQPTFAQARISGIANQSFKQMGKSDQLPPQVPKQINFGRALDNVLIAGGFLGGAYGCFRLISETISHETSGMTLTGTILLASVVSAAVGIIRKLL